MSAIEASKQFYNKHMESVCHISKEYIPLNQLTAHHENCMKQAKQIVIIIINICLLNYNNNFHFNYLV